MRPVVPLVVSAWLCGACDEIWDLEHVYPDARARDSGADTLVAGDALLCTPIGHNEDGDSLDDACDPCPFDSDNTVDDDGDGIALACDPDPAVANQVLLFTGFPSDSAAQFELHGGTIMNDGYRATTGASALMWSTNASSMHIIAGFRVASRNASAMFHEVGVMPAALFVTEPNGLACVLGDQDGDGYIEVYQRNRPAADTPIDAMPVLGSPLTNFDGTVRAFYTAGKASYEVGCAFSSSSGPTSIATTTAIAPSGKLALFALNVDVTFDFLFVTTRP